MSSVELLEQETPAKQAIGPLDSASPEEQMRAIDLAMRHYFEAENWLAEQNRRFPGLLKARCW
jgi:hypothetical protein